MNLYTINRGVSRRLHVYFSNKSRRKLYHYKINNLIKKFKPDHLTKSQIKDVKAYYDKFGFKNINTNWHRLCTHISGEFHKEYVPEDLFYNIIEPKLNRFRMHPALTDKNILNRIFKGVKQPKTIAKNLNGYYLDGANDEILSINQVIENCAQYSKIVIKSSIDSGSGRNVKVINLDSLDSDSITQYMIETLSSFEKDFSIQSFVEQHERMSLLNPGSLNTIRIISVLVDNKVERLVSVSRIGSLESQVYNISQGGIICRIKSNGRLSEKGYLYSGSSVFETNTKVKLDGFKIPCFDKIDKIIKKLHKQIPYFKLISWDIAIDEIGDLVLIEYNVRGQEILDMQFFNGPLFGQHTDKVLGNLKKV